MDDDVSDDGDISASDREYADAEVADDMRQGSINAIRGLMHHTLGSPNVPQQLCPTGRSNPEASFSADNIKTRRDWVLEERAWADALNTRYDVKKSR